MGITPQGGYIIIVCCIVGLFSLAYVLFIHPLLKDNNNKE